MKKELNFFSKVRVVNLLKAVIGSLEVPTLKSNAS